MKKYIYNLFLLFLLLSCAKNKEEINEIITNKVHEANNEKGLDIDINLRNLKADSKIIYSQVFDSLAYVKLENTPESLIGSIDKIIIQENLLYILDRYKTKSLKIFQMDGSYYRGIGKIGPGPEEQNEITDFIVDQDKIIVYDQFKHKIFYYSFDGQLLKVTTIPFTFNSFHLTHDKSYIIHCFDSDNYSYPDILGYSILKVDSAFNIQKKNSFREINKYTNHTAKNNTIEVDNKIYYHEPFNDTIFSIDDGGDLFYDYIVDFGKYKLPRKYLLKKNEKEKMDAWRNEEYAMFVGNFIITNYHLYFSYSMKGRLYHTIYSTKDQKTFSGNIISDDMYYCFTMDNILTSYDDMLVGYAESSYLVDKYERHSKEEWMRQVNDEKLVTFLDNLHYDDNPIIIFYKLKE